MPTAMAPGDCAHHRGNPGLCSPLAPCDLHCRAPWGLCLPWHSRACTLHGTPGPVPTVGLWGLCPAGVPGGLPHHGILRPVPAMAPQVLPRHWLGEPHHSKGRRRVLDSQDLVVMVTMRPGAYRCLVAMVTAGLRLPKPTAAPSSAMGTGMRGSGGQHQGSVWPWETPHQQG